MQHYGGAPSAHARSHKRVHRPRGRARRRGGFCIGVGGFHFDVLGIRRNAINRGARSVHSGGVQPLPGAQLEHVGGKKASHFDYRGVLVGSKSSHGKSHQDGVIVGGAHCLGDGRLGVGDHSVADLPQVDLVST